MNVSNYLSKLRLRIYNGSVNSTLFVYEKYFLPKNQSKSLRQLKLEGN